MRTWLKLYKLYRFFIIEIENTNETKQLIENFTKVIPVLFPNLECILGEKQFFITGYDVPAILSIILTFIEIFIGLSDF